jgi:ABC-type antimicrobial peptide transport system permease subunit
VSQNALYGDLKAAIPSVVYLPFTQGVWGTPAEMVYELRTTGDPLGYVPAVREIVQRADRQVPLAVIRTQQGLIDQTIHQEITLARLCSAFAILALVIACVGLYGTMSYLVARRRKEIGLRMALGARRREVVGLILHEVLLVAIIGLAIGLLAAFATSTLVESFLFGMTPNDPFTLLGAMTILMAAALLAGYLPARSAARIDPMIALRHE